MTDPAQLFADNAEWVNGIARRLARGLPPSFDFEDLAQEGLIALWRYVQSYDPAKNNNFRGYAYMAIRGAMLMKCRRKYWKAATGEELEPQMPYTGASPETAVIAKADSRRAHRRYNGQIFEVKRRLEAFPPSAYLERYLIERCHLEGAEVSVICTVTGLPEADVKKRLRSGLRRLKQPQLELSL